MSIEKQVTAKSLFEREDVQKKFKELLGKRSTAFITSVLQIVSQNALLAKADPASIYQAAAVAATLDLPLNSNLGFAYIVPYNQKQSDGTWKQVAQFQMGYKGFIQLAQRSGQYKTMNVTDVREGEIKSKNRLTGEFEFQWIESDSERLNKPIIGYVAFFELLNGFSKSLYMTRDQLNNHGVKFSQTFKKGFGLWKDDFDGMSLKTVIKLLISKFGPLSVEMTTAVVVDQSIVKDGGETLDVEYVDNTPEEVDKVLERVILMIEDCKSSEEVDELALKMPEVDVELFAARKEAIRNGK
jgi:recombination protein RecT